jgi:hypothetical protein
VDLIKQAIDGEELKKNIAIGGNIVLMMHHFKKKYFSKKRNQGREQKI